MDQQKPKVGIIGGAGPMAGAMLFEKLIEVAQKNYNCTQDSDFPFTLLLNYPFSDMLTNEKDQASIKTQLEECFSLFRKNNISIVAIACNTLHAFLPPNLKDLKFVHMIEETAYFLRKNNWDKPLVLCTSTSAEAKLHAQYFSCRYPDPKLQSTLDMLIEEITSGTCLSLASKHLDSLLKDEQMILGCTELSLLNEKAPLKGKKICDPNSLVAEKICELIFKNEFAVHNLDCEFESLSTFCAK